MSEVVYLLWSHKHNAWWNPKARGYTTEQDQAGRYSKAEAIKYVVGSAQCGILDQVTSMVAAPDNWRPREEAAIAPILVRNYQTSTIHRAGCNDLGDHVITWAWAIGRTVGEIRTAIAAQGGTECPSCQPLGAAS